jgi:hypothetical protein
MNPAQPVTKHRNLLTFMVMRMDNGQKSAAGSIVHHFARTQSDCEWESVAIKVAAPKLPVQDFKPARF